MPRGTRTGKQGGNTGSVEYSPGRLARMGRARRRQEERWAAKSGPVTVSSVQAERHTDDPDEPGDEE